VLAFKVVVSPYQVPFMNIVTSVMLVKEYLPQTSAALVAPVAWTIVVQVVAEGMLFLNL